MESIVIAGAFLISCFVLIAIHDFRHFIIPDWINALILIGGLAWQATSGPNGITGSLVAIIAVAVLMWGIREAHLRLRGYVGLGLGDVKLAAASVAWFSVSLFPLYLFAASALGLVYYFFSRANPAEIQTRRIAFGPFLAVALVLTWIIDISLSICTGTMSWP